MPVPDDEAEAAIIAAAVAVCRGEVPTRTTAPDRVRRVEHVLAAIIAVREGHR